MTVEPERALSVKERELKRLFIALSLLVFCCMVPTAHADLIKQGATYNRTVLLVDSANSKLGITGVSGSIVVIISKNGGAEATITPTITERGHGKYNLALSSTDTNTLGPLDLYVTATGADPADFHDQVIVGLPTVDSSGYVTLTTLEHTEIAADWKDGAMGAPPGGTPEAGSAYAMLQGMGTSVWSAGARTLTSQSDSSGVTTLLTRVPQAFLFDGLGYVRSRVDGYASLQDPATIVLGATAASYNTTLTIGNKINSAASAGDPWSTAVPGSYGAGTAGYTLVALLTRLGTPTGASLSADVAALPGAVWQNGTRSLTANVTVGGYASGQDPGTLVMAKPVDGAVTNQQAQALMLSIIAGKFVVTPNTVAKTLTIQYYRVDRTTLLATMVTNYSDTALTKAAARPTISWSNLP